MPEDLNLNVRIQGREEQLSAPSSDPRGLLPRESLASSFEQRARAFAGRTRAGGIVSGFAGGLAAGVFITGIQEAIELLKSAFLKLTDFFLGQAKLLEDVSPDVAVAQAEAQNRALFGRMRRAGAIGSDVAALIDSQSRIEGALFDIRTQILDRLLPIIVPLFERLAQFVEDIPQQFDNIATILNLIQVNIDLWRRQFGPRLREFIPEFGILGDLADRARRIADALERRDQDADLDQMLAEFIRSSEFFRSEFTFRENPQARSQLQEQLFPRNP